MALKRRKRNPLLVHVRIKRRIRSPSETIAITTFPSSSKPDQQSISSNTSAASENGYGQLTAKPDCMHPEYVVYTWVLSMIALATALKLYYLIKLLLAILMVGIYTILIVLPSNHILNEMPGSKREPE